MIVILTSGLVYMTYYLDNNVTNLSQTWQSMGSLDYPTAEKFRQMRNMEVHEEKHLLPNTLWNNESYSQQVSLYFSQNHIT